jgi:amino acid adenylation domain-containing protein
VTEPFPVTDLQRAYLLGRSGTFPLGGVATHEYVEFEGELDLDRYRDAWRAVVVRHDALRLVFDPVAGTQRVLADVPDFAPQVVDPSELDTLRAAFSHEVFDPATWPLFRVIVSRLTEQTVRVLISFDALIVDAASFHLLLRDVAAHYDGRPSAAPELTYREYRLAEPEVRDTAREYWQSRLADLPPAPPLPLVKRPADVHGHRFVRHEHTLPEPVWSVLKQRAAAQRLTPTALLLAVYAEVLAVWSGTPRFTINVPWMQRLPVHPQVNEVIGEFASFLLLAVDQTDGDTFVDRAHALQRQLFTDLEHAQAGGPALLRELAHLHGSEHTLMPVVLTSGLAWTAGAEPLALRQVYGVTQTPQVYLDAQLDEHGGALRCAWDVVEELFPAGLVAEMFAAFHTALARLSESDWSVADLELVESGLTGPERPIPDTLAHSAFAEQVRQRPDHLAVIAHDEQLTYAQLADRADRIAWWLHERGVGPDDIVGVRLERGAWHVAAVHGVLRANAAYLPIDTSWPSARIEDVLARANVRIVITQSVVDGPLPEAGPVPRTATPDNLAYVLFTSGSAGQPKGVLIEHRGVVNSLTDTAREHPLTPADRVIAVTAPHHDMSVFDLFGVLGAGGTLVIPRSAADRDAAHWARLIAEHGVTVWNSVPAMMEMLLAQGVRPDSLRLVFLGGDWIPLGVASALTGALVSVGGPTETTLWNIWYPVDRVDPDWRSVPYGRPIANTTYHLLDPLLRDVPIGVVGELYCAGPGLARGYLGDPDRTAAAFPSHPRTGERLYRTGDLGRQLAEGTIEFVGRADQQLKINGQRVEPGEIEAALRTHPSVRDAVVTGVRRADRPGYQGLAAQVIADPRPTDLREHLARILPIPLVPARIEFVDEFALTRNGKVDRTVTAPETALELVIAHAWASELGLTGIDPDEDFFVAGGDSLAATRVVARLCEALDDDTISVRHLLRTCTVAGMARDLLDAEEVPGRLEQVAEIELNIAALSDEQVVRALA